MAVLSLTDKLTALEVAKRSGFSADARRVIETFVTMNEFMLDAPMVEANEGTTHSSLVRTALPHGEHRGYNEGVGSKASQTKNIKDVISNIEIYSTVDKQLIDEAAHPKEILMTEQVAFMEGMATDFADDIFYGDHEKDPHYTNGFATRRKFLEKGKCIDAGGTGSELTSIYLVKWGWQGAKLIYPRGSKSCGVQYRDLGEQTVKLENGKEFQAYRSHYRVSGGLACGDDKAIIRIANITPNMTGEQIVELIIKNKVNLPRWDGTVSILCNDVIMGNINLEAMKKGNIILPSEDPFGNEINKIGKMRFRQCDALKFGETQVKAKA